MLGGPFVGGAQFVDGMGQQRGDVMKLVFCEVGSELAYHVEDVEVRELGVSLLRTGRLGRIRSGLGEVIAPHVGEVRGGRVKGLPAVEIAIDNGAKLHSERIHSTLVDGAA